MQYTFRQDGVQHGYLSVLDEDGSVLATIERYSIPSTHEMSVMETHECKPGQMIPLGDPRWYTYCQWCGNKIEDVKNDSLYRYGQYHRRCYGERF